MTQKLRVITNLRIAPKKGILPNGEIVGKEMHGRNRVWLGLAQTTIPAQLSIGKNKWIRQRITDAFVVTKEDLIVIVPKVNGDSSLGFIGVLIEHAYNLASLRQGCIASIRSIRRHRSKNDRDIVCVASSNICLRLRYVSLDASRARLISVRISSRRREF